MEALIVDIENELRFISKEIDALKRKKEKLHAERDPENIDSHIKAIALTLHSIYTGYEKILEMIIKGIDGDVPTALDYHTAVGDTEGGPKGNIVGQAGAGIGTDHCLGFPS
jgi:hypothetical protein